MASSNFAVKYNSFKKLSKSFYSVLVLKSRTAKGLTDVVSKIVQVKEFRHRWVYLQKPIIKLTDSV